MWDKEKRIYRLFCHPLLDIADVQGTSLGECILCGANVGIHINRWIPAFAGMTIYSLIVSPGIIRLPFLSFKPLLTVTWSPSTASIS